MRGSRKNGTNPRARGVNPRSLGTNPRATVRSKWAVRKWKRKRRNAKLGQPTAVKASGFASEPTPSDCV